MRTSSATTEMERETWVDIIESDAGSEPDFEHVLRSTMSTPDTPNTEKEDGFESLRICSLPATPFLTNRSRHTRQQTSELEAEILHLKLQLITTRASRNNAIEALSSSNTALIDSMNELATLRRELEKKTPLFQIGVAVRLGFMDAAIRIRIKGTPRIISQQLFADNAVLQAKVEACHRGNIFADASLFDPELKITGVKKHMRTFKYLYSPATIAKDEDVSVYGTAGVRELKTEDIGAGIADEKLNVHDRSLPLDIKETTLHLKRLQLHNLRASMTSCYAWTEYSLDQRTDERYGKIETKAIALLDKLEVDVDPGRDTGSVYINRKKMQLELDVALRGLEKIMKDTVKREHGRLYGRKGH